MRNLALPLLWLPLTRLFAHASISGREHLAGLRGSVIFAPNHQSHLDTPLILAALPTRYRYRLAVAMWKEYFDAHFSPEGHAWYARFLDGVLYSLVALFFNAFPVPQTQAGARIAQVHRRPCCRELVRIVLPGRRAHGEGINQIFPARNWPDRWTPGRAGGSDSIARRGASFASTYVVAAARSRRDSVRRTFTVNGR